MALLETAAIVKAAKSVLIPPATGAISKKVSLFIEEKIKKFLVNAEMDILPVSESFKSYLDRKYNNLSYAQLIAKPNQKILLKDIYVPLSLKKTDRTNEEDIVCVIDGYPSELIEKDNNILIVDKAGMGKSTMSKFMFLNAALTGSVIPVFIELRNLSEERTILDNIYDQMSELHGKLDKDRLMLFIESGQFVFFLDGFDEVSISEKKSVVQDIENFIGKAYKNKFVITSREEEGLAAFGSFQAYSINPLVKEEAYQLLRNYDNSNTTEELISALEEPQNQQIHEFLYNPLLVSLLLIAFSHKKDIPTHKHLFYENVYTALFERHDISKGQSYRHEKCSGINSIDRFAKVLRFLAKEGTKEDKLGYTRELLINKLDTIKPFIGFSFDSEGFVNDILHAVPLFTQDGEEIRWAHKSLREYFTAEYIYIDASDKEKPLKALVDKDIAKNQNLLSLYYDIDQAGFDQFITLPYFKRYIEFYNNNDKQMPLITDFEIQTRLCVLFICDTFISHENDDIDVFFNMPGDKYPKIALTPICDKYTLISLYKDTSIIYDILIEKKSTYLNKYTCAIARSHPDKQIDKMQFNENYLQNQIDISMFNADPDIYKYINFLTVHHLHGYYVPLDKCKEFITKQEDLVSRKKEFDEDW